MSFGDALGFGGGMGFGGGGFGFDSLQGASGTEAFNLIDTGGGFFPSGAESLKAFSGQTGAEAALRGAELQAESAERAISSAEQAQRRLERDLAPFTEFGLDFAGPLRSQLMGFDPEALGGLSSRAGRAFGGLSGRSPFAGVEGRAQELFGAGAGEAIMQDPVLQSMQEQISQDIMNQQSARGRAGAAETSGLLQQNLMRNAQEFLGTERQQALGALMAGEGIASGQRGELLGGLQFEEGLRGQGRNELLNALTLGQSSAAQTGAAGLGTAANVGNFLTQMGNAQAAGGIGAAQAQAQGASNLAGIGSAVAGLFMASDRRVKKNIRLVGKYKDYNTYEYEYLWGPQKYIGVMAQEVEEINPGAVTEFNGIKMVNYGAL